ncbi:HAMP domain-containing sensor histidine kinase [Nocardia terpenica]|uniref:histidine kinase n=1 Tax=Nocardia terpenica TaxID=455432 RepID=A0A6G9Z176_9NOCA|nr:HAMP domain-containing sensor histidine kinase [Nocardia terpenica]QIS19369.1 HAMP domain-containing protein [Nocardia terpenica]
MQGISLRALIRGSIVSVTAFAVLMFAVPLAVAVQRMNRTEAITELQRDAVVVAAAVPYAADRTGVELPSGLPDNRIIGIYSVTGELIRERGPSSSPLAAAAADGRTHAALEDTDLAVSAPVSSDRAVTATVRVAMPHSIVVARTSRAWMTLALLSVSVIAVAALLAGYQGGRIARPLERLTASARALGGGDFGIHAGRSRIAEADTLGEALEATATRLGRVLERERAFSTQVSHQLRTPLTALLLGLESALSRPDADLRAAASTALRRGQHLGATIEDLLRLARDTDDADGPPLAVCELLDSVAEHWRGAFTDRGRTFEIRCGTELPRVRASATAIRHVVEILVDNALVHGAGPTLVAAYAVGEDLFVEVSDRGPGLPDPDLVFTPRSADDTHGLGLVLARSLAESQGGLLALRQPAPPTFCLMLPGG